VAPLNAKVATRNSMNILKTFIFYCFKNVVRLKISLMYQG
jgi:hypothetical protein